MSRKLGRYVLEIFYTDFTAPVFTAYAEIEKFELYKFQEFSCDEITAHCY